MWRRGGRRRYRRNNVCPSRFPLFPPSLRYYYNLGRMIRKEELHMVERGVMINGGTTSTPFPMSRAISGTMLPRGERWRSIVPLRLVGGKSTGLSVATLARRPLGPAIGEVWPRFVMFRDALQRRDDVLRCNITEAFSHPWKIEKQSFLLSFLYEMEGKKIHSF